MRSNRAVQTILQAVILLLLAAIFFRLPRQGELGGGSGGTAGGPPPPSHEQIRALYRNYLNESPVDGRVKLSERIEYLSVSVTAVSVEGPTAYVKLRLEFEWSKHKWPGTTYDSGPLKDAPPYEPEKKVVYTQVFKMRYWEPGGWDFEGRPWRAVQSSP